MSRSKRVSDNQRDTKRRAVDDERTGPVTQQQLLAELDDDLEEYLNGVDVWADDEQ